MQELISRLQRMLRGIVARITARRPPATGNQPPARPDESAEAQSAALDDTQPNIVPFVRRVPQRLQRLSLRTALSSVRQLSRRPRLIATVATVLLLALAAGIAAKFSESVIVARTATLAESSRMLPFVTSTEPPTNTPTESVSVTPTPVNTASAAVTAQTINPASATPGCPAGAGSSTLPYQYDVDATVDVDGHTVTGTLKATYRNETGSSQKKIVFNVEPNRKPGVFSLNSVDTEGGANVASYTLDGPRLEVTLVQSLLVNCSATFLIGFIDRPGQIEQTYVNNFGYFGYTDRQINLGLWLPEVAPFRNGEWVTPKAWMIGEYVGSEMAAFTAKISLQGKTLDKWEVIGPGEVHKTDNHTWTFALDAGRSLTLSVDQGMSKLTTTISGGLEIDFYTFPPVPLPKGTADAAGLPGTPGAPAYALQSARDAVQVYSRLYGPAPFKRLVLVEGEFPDGLEFSGIVFVSKVWFGMYNGQPDSWLTLITAHEISHQWWYSLVGDDQGNDPFLDEGLAIYSESLFVENQYPKLLPWWWSFRVKSYAPQGYVDSSVYDFTNLRTYLNAVYLRGALMLQDIRNVTGDDAFMAWLRNYRATEAGKVATVTDFWQAMAPDDYAKTEPIREKYLHTPDPLHRFPSSTANATGAANGTAPVTLSPTGRATAPVSAPTHAATAEATVPGP